MTAKPTSLRFLVEQADELYSARHELAKVEKSVELLRSAERNSFEIDWRLARAYFFVGQESGSLVEKKAVYAAAVKAARNAVKESADRVEGNFWLGVNLALLAQLQAKPFAILRALQAKRSLVKAVEIDRGYHGAGPLRVLARLQHNLPRMLGGGFERARQNYEAAIRIDPTNTVTRIYYAELLLKMNRVEKAHEQLQSILLTTAHPVWKFECERDQARAKTMLATLGRRTGAA
jgi:hypothetical protein